MTERGAVEVEGLRIAYERAGEGPPQQRLRQALELADQLHTGIPQSRLVVIPGAGHLCNLEAPERFNEETRDFLGSVPR